ncbi:hypothetical protein [Sphingomonas sp. BK235]|uniref:hypothetical protein n=1 Tax=Sphingomonas sp. BK235 TaxID=2512131 RepID=UPI0014049A8B|nr:hypothetical protein [Sphingomonas sp. BK235]
MLTLLPSCGKVPPVLPFIAVGMYNGECGYDWNDVAFSIKEPERREPWKGSKDVAVLIQFPPVDRDCVLRAYKILVHDGFRRIYVTSTKRLNAGAYSTPLMP